MADFNLVQMVWDRSLIDPEEDVAVTTCHIRKVIDNFPDLAPMDDQARTDFTTDMQTWINTVSAHLSTKIKLKELRFYDVPATPGANMGDPVKVTAMNVAGTSTSLILPPQVSCSVTFKTEQRKRWGRFYVPGLTGANLDEFGRWGNQTCATFSTATAGLTFRGGTGAALVVFSRIHWNHEDPTEVQVDNVPDVVRRRRFSHTTFRSITPASP